MINGHGNCGAQTERDGETSHGNGEGGFGISLDDFYIQLDGNYEEEEDNANGAGEREEGKGTLRENRVGKVGNAPEDSWTKKDATDDLSNDSGLTDPSK